VARKPKQRALSFFLLKDQVASWTSALRDPSAVQLFDLRESSPVKGVVAAKPQANRKPGWVEYLGPNVKDATALEALLNRSSSALLLLTAGGRRFALSFGYGRHLLDPESYEHDFGLKVVLNIVEPERLKSVDSKTFDESTVHTRTEVSRESTFASFGLDVSRDLVRAVTGRPVDTTIAERVTGAEALALATRVQFEGLPELCERLLRAYGSEEYQKSFPWIDHLRPIKDPGLIKELDEALVDDLRKHELTDAHLAPPAPMAWERAPGFTFSTLDDDDELDSDPRITAYLASIDTEDLSLKKLKHDRVQAREATSGDLVEDWPVFRCLVYEGSRGDEHFALTGGQWFKISGDFYRGEVDFVESLPDLGLNLPEAEEGVDEGDYNTEAAKATGALCLDRKNVNLPDGDKVEVCDLLTDSPFLVHVKKRGSSSNLSHLFSQGLVSAEMLLGDGGFRESAREIVGALDSTFERHFPENRPEPGDYVIGYVVITRSKRETPLTLPFFSVVNLASAARRLQTLGFKVATQAVSEKSAQTDSE
jgi:uncharacterized protein (TIGR04141 family)